MITRMIEVIAKEDQQIAEAIKKELERQNRNIELIASENIVSEAVLMATGSVLTNKYAEGYPNKRYYGGCYVVDEIETLAIERAKQLFGCKYANVQPHSGSQANFAVYHALCEVGDTIMGMSLDNGGHLTHGSPFNFSGKNYNVVFYGVDKKTCQIDYQKVEEIAKQCKPKMIIAGASSYPRIIDFKKMAEIAHSVGAYLMVDMAHIAGLVAAKVHPTPIGYADVVTTTSHKTLRGPRGGLILCNDAEIASKINAAIFPGTQGGPLEHVIAAKAISFKEALTDEFVDYQKRIVANAKAMAKAIVDGGLDLVSGGTDNHLVLIDLRKANITGKEMEKRLDEIYITVNKNVIPFDPEKPFVTSGIRIGSPTVTTRGFTEEDCYLVGKLIVEATKEDFQDKKEQLIKQVIALTEKYPIYGK
ncbi:MAG TPA: serine hydroxymethyltransferase [Erysipelotrichaceae bacterium]|mgnify:FL=1|jgi:glycine hydroxymethyltransferase|nr:serine hydroxymethyltransferase [Erysipelotrichia bacterium]HPX32232.1 serine hydroxymethyltransferase [Erysipelotrichaceae bacterium]HQA85036.1 serine hydroxymethyltransferase [Erysipelotrichaceae bacterium]